MSDLDNARRLAMDAPVVDPDAEFVPAGSVTPLVRAIARVEVALANRNRSARGNRNRAHARGATAEGEKYDERAKAYAEAGRMLTELRRHVEEGRL